MGYITEANTKVLSVQLFLGVVALQTPMQKNPYMLQMGLFPSMVTIKLLYGELALLMKPFF